MNSTGAGMEEEDERYDRSRTEREWRKGNGGPRKKDQTMLLSKPFQSVP